MSRHICSGRKVILGLWGAASPSMILPIKLFSSQLFEVNGRLDIHQPGKLPEKKAMRSHQIELAGIDLPERLELKFLQIIASKNVSGIALIFFLELQIVE